MKSRALKDDLLGAVRECLRLEERPSLSDNFFELGGDSLSAVEIMERVESTHLVQFPLEVLFSTGDLQAVYDSCLTQTGVP